MNKTVLQVRNVSVAFGVPVADHVSFELREGEFFALVGESGSGKSVTAMTLVQLLPRPGAKIISGEVILDGVDLLKIPLSEIRKYRGKRISCIFQEPMLALNPVLSIGAQLREVLRELSLAEAAERIEHFLNLAGFSGHARILKAFPHELSGGMLQRVCIVMALLPLPQVLIADEPTTALDVTVQAQVMDVLRKLARESKTAVLLITHNMGLVAQYAQRVGVLYAGQMVEMGDTDAVIRSPEHPYTRGLLAAIPEMNSTLKSLHAIPGSVPSPADYDSGCRFRTRCAFAVPVCQNPPPCKETDSHFYRCWIRFSLQS
ncbi:MAG: ABC transporter ATP-binding protein [Fibrobacter sp.]|jgi:oligopeptide/dipeptide ABC transporter ATP-binding protein|nr:ABC transporter ATP-binding protein [Fibrobacter sp.]